MCVVRTGARSRRGGSHSMTWASSGGRSEFLAKRQTPPVAAGRATAQSHMRGRRYREPMARTVSIVPHTHWDREWYSPFQTFRLRLVDLLDGFLDHLERDPSYARFLLDGQMAVVDDYLEVRPEAEARLRQLASSGRVAMGPWYI